MGREGVHSLASPLRPFVSLTRDNGLIRMTTREHSNTLTATPRSHARAVNPEPTASPLPPHVGAPPFVRRTSTSQHRTVVYLPCLRNPLSTLSPELKITCSRKDLRSVAVAFAKSSLLHTQLEKRRGLGPAITTRLTELDPEPRIVPLLEVSVHLPSVTLVDDFGHQRTWREDGR